MNAFVTNHRGDIKFVAFVLGVYLAIAAAFTARVYFI